MSTITGLKAIPTNWQLDPSDQFAYIRMNDLGFYNRRNEIEKVVWWGGCYELPNGVGNYPDILKMLVPGRAGDLPLMFEIIRLPNSSPMQIMHYAFVTINGYLKTAYAKMWHRLILAASAEVLQSIDAEIGRIVNEQQTIAKQYLEEWTFLRSLARCEVGACRTNWPGLVMTRTDAGQFTFLGDKKALEIWAQDGKFSGNPEVPDQGGETVPGKEYVLFDNAKFKIILVMKD